MTLLTRDDVGPYVTSTPNPVFTYPTKDGSSSVILIFMKRTHQRFNKSVYSVVGVVETLPLQ